MLDEAVEESFPASDPPEPAQPGSTLREVFVGASKTLARSEVTLVADHLELAGIKRETLTLTYIFDLGAGGHHK